MDPLNNPALYDELENNKNHAKFLMNQIRQIRDNIQQTRKMIKTQKASQENNGEESQVIRQIQAEMVGLVQDLDDTTKRIQVLIGLPNINKDQIELDKLQVSQLGTNPLLTNKTYGILQRVPKLMVVGGQTVVISPTIHNNKLCENDQTSEDDTTSSTGDDYKDCFICNSSSDSKYATEKELSSILKGPGHSVAQIEFIEYIRKNIKAKRAKKKCLELENAVMKETLKRLMVSEQISAVLDFIHKGYPENEVDVNVYIETLQKEQKKIQKMVDKTLNEIRQQQRTIYLLSNERLEDPGHQSKNQDHLFDRASEKRLLTEDSTRRSSYEEVKILQERKNKQLENLKADIDDTEHKNEQMKSENDKVNDEVNELLKLMDERRETKELKLNVDTIQEDLNSKRDQITNTKEEEANLRELLDAQESEMARDRRIFLLAEEKFQQERLFIMKTEEEKMCLIKAFHNDIEYYRHEIETKCAFYRNLPFIIAAYKTQCAQLEGTRYTVYQDIALATQEYDFYRRKMEALERRKEEEETQVTTFQKKLDNVGKLRDHFDARSIEMNQLQKTTRNIQSIFDEIQNRIKQKSAEIESLRQTIKNFKEEFASNQMSLRGSHEKKKKELLRAVLDLEMRFATQKGLIHAVENKCT